MKKLIVLILILMGLFAYGQRDSSNTAMPTQPLTAKEQRVEAHEESLTTYDRLYRCFHFREAVLAAVEERTPRMEYVPTRQIPLDLQHAVVATEDRRFYTHGGIDMYGILRAMYVNFVAGHTVEGGSTITQQLVKNLFLTSQRTMSRKLEEMVLSILMERNFTKEEILTMYLNIIYYGNQYYGLREASRGYFLTAPINLSLAESAMLAGLPQAPTYYNPVENPEAALARRATVLDLMVEAGYITQSAAKMAKLAPLLPHRYDYKK